MGGPCAWRAKGMLGRDGPQNKPKPTHRNREQRGGCHNEGWRTGEKEKGNTVSKIVVSLHSGVVTW